MNAGRVVNIGTRASRLARWQAEHVAGMLRALHPDTRFEVTPISTEGDRDTETPLRVLGARGVFVKDIERALLDGTVDLAVHSLKDQPSEEAPGLVLAAVLPRGDVRDALVSHGGQSLRDLPAGSRVGTSSARRLALLRRLRPDLEPVELRGNVDTRLTRVGTGSLDAAVLAAAGLERLGESGRICEYLDPAEFVPSPGQGALVVQLRAGDQDLLLAVAELDDAATRAATDAERACLSVFGGGCSVPLAAWARVEAGRVELVARAFHASLDGRGVEASESGAASAARAVGERAGRALMHQMEVIG
ncbi:MAG: hydroxymethylbilane synthase [Candidatus Dormibacteria bacterium]